MVEIVDGTVMLQYHIDSRGVKVDFEVLCHSNSQNTSRASFYPTSGAEETMES